MHWLGVPLPYQNRIIPFAVFFFILYGFSYCVDVDVVHVDYPTLPLFLHCSIISWMIPFLLFAPELDLWKKWASDSTQTINSDLSYCSSWLLVMMRTVTVRMMMTMMIRFEWWTYWHAAVLTVWKKLADNHLQFLNSIHTTVAAIVIGAFLYSHRQMGSSAKTFTVWKKLSDDHCQFLNSSHTTMTTILINDVLLHSHGQMKSWTKKSKF